MLSSSTKHGWSRRRNNNMRRSEEILFCSVDRTAFGCFLAFSTWLFALLLPVTFLIFVDAKLFMSLFLPGRAQILTHKLSHILTLDIKIISRRLKMRVSCVGRSLDVREETKGTLKPGSIEAKIILMEDTGCVLIGCIKTCVSFAAEQPPQSTSFSEYDEKLDFWHKPCDGNNTSWHHTKVLEFTWSPWCYTVL